jgi:hypothetical protein
LAFAEEPGGAPVEYRFDFGDGGQGDGGGAFAAEVEADGRMQAVPHAIRDGGALRGQRRVNGVEELAGASS